jgi:transcription initiation factor TFIID subunit TAF12
VLDLFFDSTLDAVNAVAEVEDMQLCSSSNATTCNITSSSSGSSSTTEQQQLQQQQQLQHQQQQRPLAVLLKPADYYGGPYVSTAAADKQLQLPLQPLSVSMPYSQLMVRHQ